MARGRGGWLKQKWQEGPPLPRHKGLPAGKERRARNRGEERESETGQLMEKRGGDRGEAWASEMTLIWPLITWGVWIQSWAADRPSEPPAAFTQPHLSRSTLIRTIWLKDEPTAVNASSKDSSTVSPPLTLSNIWIPASQPSEDCLQLRAGASGR